MLKTNYDTNSKGLNIEVRANYDTWLSQSFFNDDINILQHDGYREYSVGFYTCSGTLEVPTIKDLITVKGSTRDIKRFLVKENYLYKESLENIDREDLISELLSQLEYNWNDIAKDEVSSSLLQDYKIDILLNYKNYDFIETRGYSQGDCSICIINKNNDYIPSKKQIDNLYWDSPISISININNIELTESDLLNDMYEGYDKEDVIEKILSLDCIKELNKSNEIKEELENLIPSELSYN